MNCRSIFTISTVTALALATLPGSAAAQQKSLKEQLVGTWSLVSYDSIGSDGSRKAVFGVGPKGTLMLDANGHYALLLTDSNRAKWKSNLRTQITTEDLGNAARGLVAQFGTWSMDEASKTLTRKIEGALNPGLGGAEQKLTVSLSGDELRTAVAESGVTGGKTEAVYRKTK